MVDGSLKFGKIRNIYDKKKMRVIKNSVSCLFGWQALPEGSREVVITEGEVDALSWYQLGFHALSVPNGAKGLGWLDEEYERLERFDTIYVAFDMDAPGQEGALELISRLGSERCALVDTGDYEDANLLLQSGDLDEVRELANKMVRDARPLDPVELKQASRYVNEMIPMFLDTEESEEDGFDPPFEKLRGLLKHRWGEYTVVVGINGHGKSQFIHQTLLSGISQGHRACIYSGEMPIKRLLYRSDIQAVGKSDLTIPDIQAVHQWYHNKLWLFELTGSAKAQRLLEVFEYAHRRYGIRIFIIDSLLKCGIAEDDKDGQKEFIEAVCDFKNEYPVHVFLITHPRKGEGEFVAPGKMDVRGSASIVDLADTQLSLWRNKVKEGKINKAISAGEAPDPEQLRSPDAILYCHKQRNGEWEKQTNLWWHGSSYQFKEKEDNYPVRYVE